MDLFNKGYVNNVSVDIENQRELIKFVDTGIQWRSQPWAIGQLPNSLKVIAQ
jgi:hypothetical protein